MSLFTLNSIFGQICFFCNTSLLQSQSGNFVEDFNLLLYYRLLCNPFVISALLRSSPINVQLPSPGLIKHSPQVSPEKVVILMSPSKDGAASAGSSSSSLDQGHQGGLIMSPGRLIMSNAPGRILLQADKISELTDKKTSPNKSTTTTVSVQSPTKVLNTVPVTSSKQNEMNLCK